MYALLFRNYSGYTGVYVPLSGRRTFLVLDDQFVNLKQTRGSLYMPYLVSNHYVLYREWIR